MKIKYNLLWIENDQDWMESIEDDIKSMVEDNAFEYVCHNCKQEEENLNYNAYDLILMDLNLDGQPSGDLLIKKIRENGIYTDVVFYSSGGLDNIKQKASEYNLEGVYFSGRDRVQFVDKVSKVIETTIKKVQDLPNLRGLVMGEVSELDSLMQNILEKYFTTEERLSALHNKVTKNREKNLRKNLQHAEGDGCDKLCTLTIRNMPIKKIAEAYDSSQKAHSVHEVLKDFIKQNKIKVENSNFFNSYKEEIIEVRNNLAHCESKTEDGVEILRTRKGDISFTAEEFKEIRKNIAKYNKLFNEILQAI